MAEVSVLAEINSYGARVCIVGEATSSVTCGDSFPSRGSPEGCPEWVKVGRGLMEARCREYEQETGHWPEMALLERFSAEMGKRLEAFIRDPKRHPWRAVGIREFEEETGSRR